MSYRIVTDATADISEDLIRDVPEITIVPMEITLDGELMRIERSDGPDVSAFYEKIRNGADAKTSQINIEVYREVFSGILDEGLDVLYLCFTSGLSGTINAAHIAMDELADDYPGRKIVCIDTLAAAIGEGFLVHEAARLQGEGLSMSELIDWVEKNKLLVCHKFAVDSMTHLLKGG
ncbi:MAG: DegV family EDD domain-containing protein, partial [Lachnospiraceae bacterium]|nr:DegV family EDD domain-containing protein [Lachnospiraceae bacterium]